MRAQRLYQDTATSMIGPGVFIGALSICFPEAIRAPRYCRDKDHLCALKPEP